MKTNISYVVSNSKHVKINKEEIAKLSKEVEIIDNKHLFKSLVDQYDEKTMLRFLILCESINFCYWEEKNWKINYNDKIFKGSIAMFLSLKRKIETDPDFFEIKNLINLKYKDFCAIFISVDKPLSLLKKRYNNFMQTVKILNKKQDSFYDEIYTIKSDIEMLKYIIKTFPSFNDISFYKFKKIHFYKRATLLVRDYFELVPKINRNIKSISNLHACADYVIPNTLREYGVLEYSDKLKKIIDNKKKLKHNSKMEIEIRANMIYCVKLLKEELEKKNIYIDEVFLDNILWNKGKNTKNKYHHHRTKTIYY